MTLHTYPDVEQRSQEWFDQRRGLVTASVVGQLLTPSTLKTANNDVSRGLIASLAAERVTGFTEPTPMNSDMWRGVEHEPYAREKYAEHHAPVTETGFMVREFDNGTLLGYSPDGLVGDNGLIEIKCPRAKTHLRTIVSGVVPAFHQAQLQSGLLVSGREFIDFVSFCGGLPLFVKRVHPDPKWHDAIIAAVQSAEESIAALVASFHEAAQGLPATDRVPDLDVVI